MKLAHQLITQGGAEALLTSFSKHARNLALHESQHSIKPLIKLDNSAASEEGRNKRFYGPRNRFYLTCIGATLKRFCQSLDQELLHAVRSVQCPSAQLYNWLAQGDRMRRLQALKAQPVLIPVLVIGHAMPWPHLADSGILEQCPWGELQEYCGSWDDDCTRDGAGLVGHATDTGLPLNKVLAWLFSTPISAIRYLGQQRVYDTGSALSRLDAFTRWPGLLLTRDTITCSETGLQIVELRCADDLDREHRALGHCIDTYDYHAFLGNCRLLSIRSGATPLASVELALRAHGHEHKTGQAGKWTPKHLHVVQIRGHHNETPDTLSPVMKAFERFIAEVRNGRIPVNLDWPNLVAKMDRYADKTSIYNIRFAEEVIGWAERLMDRGL
ncbi:hypothetical protein [Pseudomonas caricapapayae]